jgi:DNA (cytosine-5)-methyltransferase 1
MTYTYLEVCSGCGGLSLGLHKSGLKSVALIEMDKNCCKTLKKNFPDDIIIENDMRKIDFTNYQNKVDILIGGIPCQSFSQSGKRQGLDDENKGGLFYDFLRILNEVKPKMFLIENVEGLKTINNGETLKKIIEELENMNYNVFNKVLNAVNFLVPQKRKRIIIVGTYNDVVFNYPIGFNKIITLREALNNVPDSSGIEYSEKKKIIMEYIPEGGCWINLPEELQKEYLGKSYNSGGGKRGMARRLSWDEPSLTLTTSCSQKQTERCHPEETRPLKIREYARIQTFPDNFVFEGGITSIYKQIGNAVPCMLGYFLGNRIIESLNKINFENIISEFCGCLLLKKIEVINEYWNEEIYFKTMSNIKELTKEFIIKYIKPIYETDIILSESKIDEIKKNIDIVFKKFDEDMWIEFEKARIKDKKINNKIGELHEYILSNLDNWEKCKNSKYKTIKNFHCDIYKKDKSIFIELKNNFNTLNAASRKQTISNLLEIKKKYPDAICAIGIINGVSRKKIIYSDKNEKIEIFEYSNKELFKLITNNDNYYNIVKNFITEELADIINHIDDQEYENITNKKKINTKENKKIIKVKKINNAK